MSTRTLTEADGDAEITLMPGDTLNIALAENPTTGYRWSVEPSDPSILEAVPAAYEAAGAAAGAGGRRSFSFRAIAPGQTRLSLILQRPWEGAPSARKRFAVTLTVRDGS